MTSTFDYSEVYNQALEQLKTEKIAQLPALNTLINIVSDVFHCPTALLSIYDKTQEYATSIIVSSVGLQQEDFDKPYSFSRYVYDSASFIMVEDATKDDRFKQNAYIKKHQLKFCTGCPITLDGNEVIGTLCILDTSARLLSNEQQHRLKQFKDIVESLLQANLNWLQMQLACAKVEQARAYLMRKEALSEEVAKVSGVGSWEYDIETNALYWSPQTRDIIGVDTNFKPSLDSGFAFFAPEAQDIIRKTVDTAIESNKIWSSELPFINNQGKHMWVKTTGHGVYENGALCRLIGAFQDVSERKLLEQKMSESERLMQAKNDELSAIVNHIPQGVAVYDMRGLLKYWNNQHCDIYAINGSHIRIRQSFREFLSHRYNSQETIDNPDKTMDEMYAAFDNDQSFLQRFQLQSGAIIEALYSSLPDSGWICTSVDITEQEKSKEKIHYAAHHDSLTGLANRASFNEYTDKLLANTQRDIDNHILMLIDLDYFKAVNDTYGHLAGDEVLKEVANRLKNTVRDNDLVCRFGGDEFALVISGSHNLHETAEELAQRIVESIAQPFTFNHPAIHIGVSIGMSTIETHDTSLNNTMKQADAALYKVKERGRNGYQLYKQVQHKKC